MVKQISYVVDVILHDMHMPRLVGLHYIVAYVVEESCVYVVGGYGGHEVHFLE